MHVPQVGWLPDDPLALDPLDELLDGTLLDGLLLDGLLERLLPLETLDTDDGLQRPNRASNGNRPGELSKYVQTQGRVQSPSSSHRVPSQIMTHSPEQVSDEDDWLPADWLD